MSKHEKVHLEDKITIGKRIMLTTISGFLVFTFCQALVLSWFDMMLIFNV